MGFRDVLHAGSVQASVKKTLSTCTVHLIIRIHASDDIKIRTDNSLPKSIMVFQFDTDFVCSVLISYCSDVLLLEILNQYS
jgi:hypothetical protein